ncbi:MAG TPA: hypothetical protein VFQ26_08575 [Nitrospiraceae bacterium]|nr:hypothetical protein [Nitrospiraceae bacterium]
MNILKSNQQRVQNLTPWEIWGFIAGRVLVAFALGLLAAQYFPAMVSRVGIPILVVGVAFLLFAAKGLARNSRPQD